LEQGQQVLVLQLRLDVVPLEEQVAQGLQVSDGELPVDQEEEQVDLELLVVVVFGVSQVEVLGLVCVC
jgi:hypothetical protein